MCSIFCLSSHFRLLNFNIILVYLTVQSILFLSALRSVYCFIVIYRSHVFFVFPFLMHDFFCSLPIYHYVIDVCLSFSPSIYQSGYLPIVMPFPTAIFSTFRRKHFSIFDFVLSKDKFCCLKTMNVCSESSTLFLSFGVSVMHKILHLSSVLPTSVHVSSLFFPLKDIF